MSFDPDKYLAQKSAESPTQGGFDPDAYLKTKSVAPSEPVDPGLLNDLGRGIVSGATFGFGDEIAGGLEAGADLLTGNISLDKLKEAYQKHRDESRTLYKQAEERSPIASTIGNITGGIAPALLTMGGSSTVQGAGALARIAAGAKAGLGAGALGGLGTSEADTIAGDLSNAAEGAKMGALFGGAISGGIEAAKGIKALGKGIAGAAKKTQLAKDNIDALNLGYKNTDIITSEGLDAAEKNIRSTTKDTAFALKDVLQEAGDDIGAAKALAKERGFNVNTKNGIDKLKNFITEASDSIDDRDRDDALIFKKLIDNLEMGVEKEIPIEKSLIGKAKIIKAKPSSEEKLLQRVATETESERLVKNPKAFLERELVENTDENGNDVISILRSAADKETGEIAPVSAKTILNDPGVEAGFIPPEPGALVSSMEKVRLGGQNLSELPIDQADKLKTVLKTQTGVNGGTPNLKTPGALRLAKSVGSEVDDGIREFPEIAAANDKYSAAAQAFETLGLNDLFDSFEKDAATKMPRLTRDAEAKLNATIKRMARDTDAGENASNKLNEALRLLDAADPKAAAAMRPKIEDASRVLDLAQKAQRLGFLNKSTYLKSGSIYASNATGLALRKLSDSTPDQIKQLAQKLISSGSAAKMKLAQELGPIMQNKDNVSRNAAIFALQQNPEYRKMLQEQDKEEDQK